MAKSTFSSVDEYGFERADDFNYAQYEEFMEKYIRVLAKRSRKWDELRAKERNRRSEKMKRYVRKGIPGSRREETWMRFSGAETMKNGSALSYKNLSRRISKSEIIETIEIDIPRTFPDNIFFTRDQTFCRQLFKILATFAHENETVGYCQGLNYIAGLLLLATRSENSAYWLLKALVEKILPPYYINSMAGLLVDFAVLEELVQREDGAIHGHMKALGMPWALTTAKWFICLYVEVLPVETVLRIWDCLFYEGSKVIFKVALTLLKLHKDEILQSNDINDLVNCFKRMRDHVDVINCHKFMALIFKTTITNKTIYKLRKKHATDKG